MRVHSNEAKLFPLPGFILNNCVQMTMEGYKMVRRVKYNIFISIIIIIKIIIVNIIIVIINIQKFDIYHIRLPGI